MSEQNATRVVDETIHTPPPWTNSTALPVRAGEGHRLLLGGDPPLVDCRVLSEANYQLAKRCVNAHDDLLEACKTALAESVGQPSRRISYAGLDEIQAAIVNAEAPNPEREIDEIDL